MIHLGQKKFSFDMQKEFSRASGDYNPIHLDHIKAKRSGSGEIVVHGINVFLWVLEEALRTGSIDGNTLAELEISCKFKKPVFLDEILILNFNKLKNKEVFVVEKDGVVLVKVQFKAALQSREYEKPLTPFSYNVGLGTDPLDLDVNLITAHGGHIILNDMDVLYLEKEYPYISNVVGNERLRAITSLSALVGMVVPGLYSLFAGFSLQIGDLSNTNTSGLYFSILNYNPRHGFLKLFTHGSGISAQVESLVRPRPALPPSCEQVKKIVGNKHYYGRTVLIVGGSRGVGAIAATILANGGARVAITYKDSKDQADLLTTHRGISSLQYDVANSLESLNKKSFLRNVDTLLYFATPKIFFRRTKSFDDEKKEEFSRIYVHAFDRIVSSLVEESSHFKYCLFPSSVEVESVDSTNVEYIAAKLEGESLCDELENRYLNLKILKPRLPKIQTDQTAWFGQEVETSVDTLYVKDVLDDLYNL